jgi:hypothetical protein
MTVEESPTRIAFSAEAEETMSTDKKGTKILARTFFNQLRAGGYTPNQIIGISTELIELVTNDLRDAEKPVTDDSQKQELRHSA